MAEHFNATYAEGHPPWDIGHAQPDFVALAEAGEISGRVIDVGCGTGENAMFLASRGLDVTGVDFAPTAIELAMRKASERGLVVRFEVGNVLELGAYASYFDAAIDSGCFHVLDDADRARYASSLHAALREGGRLFVECFSERQPGEWGPRRVTQAELRETFGMGWRVDWIRDAHFEIGPQVRQIVGDAVPRIEAWLMAATRIEPSERVELARGSGSSSGG